MEDLTGNIRRVVDGLADEIALRIVAELPENLRASVRAKTKSHVRQVLFDWFLGDFIPPNKKERE